MYKDPGHNRRVNCSKMVHTEAESLDEAIDIIAESRRHKSGHRNRMNKKAEWFSEVPRKVPITLAKLKFMGEK